MPVLLTFFARQGGKTLLRKRLLELFPAGFSTYVEPFAGAASLFFTRKKPTDNQSREVLNDLDPYVYNLLEDVRRVTPEDVEAMDFLPNREKWCALKATNPSSYKERFYRNVYINWWSYAGCGMGYHTRGDRHNPINRKPNFIKKLGRIQERLSGVLLHNKPYQEILTMYDAQDTFFFLDPPYYETNIKSYEQPEINMDELHMHLKQLKGKFMLTLNDHPYICETFVEFNITRLPTLYSIRRNANVKYELIITNY
jgi:DNA adenine methylase